MAHRGRKNADEVLALAFACGSTAEQAAQKAGVGVRTAERRLADPAFARRVQEARDAIVQRASGVLTAALLEAIKTLLELQRPPAPPSVRLGAARAVIDSALKVRTQAELEQRLAAVEERCAAAERAGARGGKCPDAV